MQYERQRVVQDAVANRVEIESLRLLDGVEDNSAHWSIPRRSPIERIMKKFGRVKT